MDASFRRAEQSRELLTDDTEKEAPVFVADVRVYCERDEWQDVSYLEPDSGRYDDVKSPVTRRMYEKQDRERLAAWKRDEWTQVVTCVEVVLENADGFQKTYRASCGGTESDSEPEHFQALAVECLADINAEIQADGFAPVPVSELPKVSLY